MPLIRPRKIWPSGQSSPPTPEQRMDWANADYARTQQKFAELQDIREDIKIQTQNKEAYIRNNWDVIERQGGAGQTRLGGAEQSTLKATAQGAQLMSRSGNVRRLGAGYTLEEERLLGFEWEKKILPGMSKTSKSVGVNTALGMTNLGALAEGTTPVMQGKANKGWFGNLGGWGKAAAIGGGVLLGANLLGMMSNKDRYRSY